MPQHDESLSLKWVIGVTTTICAFIVTTLIGFQGNVDSRQDELLKENERRLEETIKSQADLSERLSRDSRSIAEALKDVSATLREIDARGSQALREHERREGAH
jgi:uncharacterized Zn finger protein (UPF0148 family)